jgi:hypothetical protein
VACQLVTYSDPLTADCSCPGVSNCCVDVGSAVRRGRSISVVGLGLAGGLVYGLLFPSTAGAAPGDASARGVDIAVDAQVANSVVFTGSTLVGIADAPLNGGTDSHTNLGVGLSGGGFNAFGTVALVTATRGSTASTATSHVPGIAASVLGTQVLQTGEADATVTCPTSGTPTASTSVANVTLFGNPVTVGTTPVTASGPVPVAGPTFTGGTLSISLQSVQVPTLNDATAKALTATLTLSVVSNGTPITVPVGTINLASATCTRPATANVPAASGMVPISGPTAGGQTVTVLGSDFPPGGALVTFGGVPGSNVVVASGGTSLTVVTPPGAPGPVPVVVTTPQGSSTVPIPYTYVGGGPSPSGGSGGGPTGGGGTGRALHPAIRSITPSHGPTTGGTRVSITGSGFTGITRVTFDGVPGTGVTVNPAGTVITVTTPPNAAGPAAVILHRANGETMSAGIFTFVARQTGAPVAPSATPGAPPMTNGTPTAQGQLANTGSNIALTTSLGSALLALGALLLRSTRRLTDLS